MTDSAPIELSVSYTSPLVALAVNASTRQAPIYLEVPPSFSGGFRLSAVSSVAEIRDWEARSIGDDEALPLYTSSPESGNSREAFKSTTQTSPSELWGEVPRRNEVDNDMISADGDLYASTTLAPAVLKFMSTAKLAAMTPWKSGCVVDS